MYKKPCYFKCNYEGYLFNFPAISYTSYERYCKWKNILRKKDKEKDDYFISNNIKLCGNHFEKYYFTAKNRLTRHAVPTLRLGITLQQEELLCTFIEEYPHLIKRYSSCDKTMETLKTKLKTIEPQLNTLGPEKTNDSWEKYLCEVMSNLKSKEVIWINETSECGVDMQNVKNADDFTDLELKILQVWNKEVTAEDTNNHFESYYRDSNDIEIECIIEHEDRDNSRDSETSGVSWTNRNNETTNKIVTFTLNVATGGQTPLLQAAEIAPYEAPQDESNVKCKCKHPSNEVQDEFDAFGKDIAQQLRSMPVQTAVETRKLIMSVLRSKQSKVLNDSFLQY